MMRSVLALAAFLILLPFSPAFSAPAQRNPANFKVDSYELMWQVKSEDGADVQSMASGNDEVICRRIEAALADILPSGADSNTVIRLAPTGVLILFDKSGEKNEIHITGVGYFPGWERHLDKLYYSETLGLVVGDIMKNSSSTKKIIFERDFFAKMKKEFDRIYEDAKKQSR